MYQFYLTPCRVNEIATTSRQEDWPDLFYRQKTINLMLKIGRSDMWISLAINWNDNVIISNMKMFFKNCHNGCGIDHKKNINYVTANSKSIISMSSQCIFFVLSIWMTTFSSIAALARAFVRQTINQWNCGGTFNN